MDMTLDEKVSYINSLPADKRDSFVQNMSNDERNSFLNSWTPATSWISSPAWQTWARRSA
jgi:hypothetical protein